MTTELKNNFININKNIDSVKKLINEIKENIKTIDKLKLMLNLELYNNDINNIINLINDLKAINYNEFKDNKLDKEV